MIFVFPMAGESRRFREKGYSRPKFMLPLGDGYLFDHAVRSFAAYFAVDDFLFVLRESSSENEFVTERVRALHIAQARFVNLNRTTNGQAETVVRGLENAGVPDQASIAVFNIDTFRPGYRKPDFLGACDGYLEVFEGAGDDWSFVLPDRNDPTRVSETREKQQISRLCCTGLYYFRAAGDFHRAYRHPTPPQGAAELKERYVAPLYNPLIAEGYNIRFDLVNREDVIFCGTPNEYEDIRASPETLARLAP